MASASRKITRCLFYLLFILSFQTGQVEFLAWAASDGALDTTSEGTTDVSLSVTDLVKITGIADLNFGSYNGSGNLVLDDNICIYSNTASGSYKVTAKGSGAASAFTITNGGAHLMAYTVKFNDQPNTTGSVALLADTISAAQTGAHTTSQSCAGGNTANFEVTITQNALLNVPAGTYSGVLTLVIEPA